MVAEQFVWSPRYIDAPIMRRRDATGDGTLDETIHATNDANYHVTAIYDNTGNVVERYSYTPHGVRTIWNASMTATRAVSAYGWGYGFTGRLYDPETGFWLFRKRQFDPGLGRFIKRDPAGYVDGSSLYNGFFVGNGVDPSGMWVIDANTGTAVAEPGDTITSLWRQLGGQAYSGESAFMNAVRFFQPGANINNVKVGQRWRFGYDRNAAFFAFDGTANHYLLPTDAGGTNPRIMFELASAQYSEYFGGVGNAHEYGPVEQKYGLAEGWGASAIVDRAMTAVRESYAAGIRRVDAVGFSRGATQNVEFAFRLQAAITSGEMPGLKLGFFGFFDTVPGFHKNFPGYGSPGEGMTSIPPTPGEAFFASDSAFQKHRAHKVQLPPMASAVHLVALDETRIDFSPLNIGGAWQLGLRGAHSDVGGGYVNKGLSNYALQLMVDAAQRSGVPLRTVQQAATQDPGRFSPYLRTDPAMLPHRQLKAVDVPWWAYSLSPAGASGADAAATYEHAPRLLPPLHWVMPGWTPPMTWNGSAWIFANPNYTRD